MCCFEQKLKHMRDQLEQYRKRCEVQLTSEREVAVRLVREKKIEFASFILSFILLTVLPSFC